VTDSFAFRAVQLDADHGDQDAVLVLRDGRLTAVLCRLGPMHDALAGRWFVEAMFAHHPLLNGRTFAAPQDFAASLAPISNA
jgi:hypothetical protein